MDDAMVADVRRFNRTVTERVGALRDHFLGRNRPLGEARVLWEIGVDGREVRALRATLNLDSGYLSRTLRSLEADGLVVVEASPMDRRKRVARLTRTGVKERALLDARSDDLARSLLEPLNDDRQRRLVDAMRTVERLLTATQVEIAPADPAHPDAQRCIAAYFAELDRRSDAGYDPTAGISAEPHEMRPPAGAFLLARLHGETIGCGGIKLHGEAPCEIKRMWVADETRGLGVGRRLLEELERVAAQAGATVAHIETSRHLTEAISLYRSAGWVEVAPFNDEPFADHWFEKRLAEVPQ
jgi:DNA-binding MarR family transcriptional regulator/GNAT superfamily N-acetyltransferase